MLLEGPDYRRITLKLIQTHSPRQYLKTEAKQHYLENPSFFEILLTQADEEGELILQRKGTNAEKWKDRRDEQVLSQIELLKREIIEEVKKEMKMLAKDKTQLRGDERGYASGQQGLTLKQRLLLIDVLDKNGFIHLEKLHPDKTGQAILLSALFNEPFKGQIKDSNIYKFYRERSYESNKKNYLRVRKIFEKLGNQEILEYLDSEIKKN